MAEALFRHAVRGRGDFRVLSAGIGAMDGQPPSHYSVLAMRELGIEISPQRSRQLTVELVRSADYIFCMTRGHVDTVGLLYPAAMEKTFLLREFDDSLDPFEKDISDPIGSAYAVYVDCRDQIEQGVATILNYMEQQHILSPALQGNPAGPVNFAIGADHGGFDLKEGLKQHLHSRGLTFKDFGALTRDPSDDYPDFAAPAAQAVADGQAELGLLLCTSGVGICIVANKIAGVRAGVAEETGDATLMRQHNDVNVLCLSGKKTPLEAARKILDAFIAGKFEGGRHERRVHKLDVRFAPANLRLRNVDPAVAEAIEHEPQSSRMTPGRRIARLANTTPD